MKEKEIKQIKAALKKYNAARNKQESALDSLIMLLEKTTGKPIQCNYFPGDGLGVVAGDSSVSNYMSISDAIAIIREKGTLDYDEFTYL